MVQMQSFFKSHLYSDGFFSAGVGPEKIESEPEEALQSATISVVADTPVDRREVSSSVDLSTLVSHKDIPCTELNLIDENVLPPGYISSPPSYRSRPPSFKTNLEETQGPGSANTAIWHTSENFENVELSKKEGGRKDCVSPKAEAIPAEKEIPMTVESPSVNKCLSSLKKAAACWTSNNCSGALLAWIVLTLSVGFGSSLRLAMSGQFTAVAYLLLQCVPMLIFLIGCPLPENFSLRVRCLCNCGVFILGLHSFSTFLLTVLVWAKVYRITEQTRVTLSITGLTGMSVAVLGCIVYYVKYCLSKTDNSVAKKSPALIQQTPSNLTSEV